jgi:hypothetical protein
MAPVICTDVNACDRASIFLLLLFAAPYLAARKYGLPAKLGTRISG